jgi:peptidoglycan/LPS O-acetylase OafA/YrhL
MIIVAILKVFVAPIYGFRLFDIGIRGIDWGVAAVFILASVIVLEQSSAFRIFTKRYAILGDASYSMYLYHTFILPFIGVLFVKLGLLSFGFTVIVALLSSIFMSLILYKVLEKPMTEKLKQAIDISRLKMKEA